MWTQLAKFEFQISSLSGNSLVGVGEDKVIRRLVYTLEVGTEKMLNLNG